MSAALKDLIAALTRDLYKPEREHLRRAELEAMTFYNRIRAEAAQEIRQWADEANIPGSPVSTEMVRAIKHAADLIDPGVD